MKNNFRDKKIIIKAMCLFEHEGKLLLNIGYDKVKDERFFRIIGGSVNFGEKTEEAIRREVREELDCEIENLKFLTVIENIFQYEGKNMHEISFIYKGDLSDKRIYEQESIHYIKINEKFDAEWVPISNILTKKIKLYPTFDYQKLMASSNKFKLVR
jgi:ADP-ribose pyrophosphatase YjhB (NUDIX family)